MRWPPPRPPGRDRSNASRTSPPSSKCSQRSCAPAPPAPAPPPDGTPLGSPPVCPADLPSLDVQAALTVLGRRSPNNDKTVHIDLHSTCLHGVDLSRAGLTGTNLTGAGLDYATLTDARHDSSTRTTGAIHKEAKDAWS